MLSVDFGGSSVDEADSAPEPLPPQESLKSDYEVLLRKSSSEVGITLKADGVGRPVVESLRESSPAAVLAAVRPGDLLSSVNGTPTLDMRKTSILDLIRGCEEGRVLRLAFVRAESVPLSPLFPALPEEDWSNWTEAMRRAVAEDDADEVRRLVGEAPEGHLKALLDDGPWRPLHKALAEGREAAAEALVSAGADLQVHSDEEDGSPLLLAVRSGRAELVDLLLAAGAQQPPEIQYAAAPLNAALRLGLLEQAKALIIHHPLLGSSSKEYLFSDAYGCSTCRFNVTVAEVVEFVQARQSAKGEPIACLRAAVIPDDQVLLARSAMDPEVSEEARFSLLSVCASWGRWSTLEEWWSSVGAEGLELLLRCAFAHVEGLLGEAGDRAAARRALPSLRFLIAQGARIDHLLIRNHPQAVRFFLQKKGGGKSSDGRSEWQRSGLLAVDYGRLLEPIQSRLVELNLSGNPLERLPAEVPWALPALDRLIVSACPNLVALPALAQGRPNRATRLSRITVQANPSLRTVPRQWFCVRSLSFLDLSENPRLEIEESPEEWSCRKLEVLNLSGCGLAVLPSRISDAVGLKTLILAANQLSSLPRAWACPLTKLVLSRNRLKAMPEGISVWHDSLKDLDASHNRLVFLPNEVVGLARLRNLCLAHNRLSSLPPSGVWRCGQLQSLDLSHNSLDLGTAATASRKTSLFSRSSANASSESASVFHTGDEARLPRAFPTVFAERLIHLNLSHNALLSVPKALGRLRALTFLDLSHNTGLSRLPEELGAMESLDALCVDGLDLRDLPDQLNPSRMGGKASSKALIQHLQAQLRKETPYRRLKVVVMGREGVGKTSLVRNLLRGSEGRRAETRKETARKTSSKEFFHQMDAAVATWQGRLSRPERAGGRKVRGPLDAEIWEVRCRGALLNVLLSDGALFLLVYRLDQPSLDQLHSALLAIKARCRRSSVLFVGTHSDLLEQQFVDVKGRNEAVVASIAALVDSVPRCPKVRGYVFVSNDQGSNFDLLRNRIMEVGDLVLKGASVPQSQLELEAVVEEERQRRTAEGRLPFLTLSEVSATVQQRQPSDPDASIDVFGALSQEDLGRFVRRMVESGLVLCFMDAVGAATEPWIFLSAPWLTRLIVAVTQKTARAKRRLKLPEVVELLRTAAADEECDFAHFLDVLTKFELILPLFNDEVLVPSLLPEEGPEMNWGAGTPVFSGPSVYCRLFRLSTSVPEGFWSRLISRLITRLNSLESEEGGGFPVANFRQRTLGRGGRLEWGRGRAGSRAEATSGLKERLTLYWASGLVRITSIGVLEVGSVRESGLPSSVEAGASVEGVVVRWKPAADVGPAEAMPGPYFGLAVDETNGLLGEFFPDSFLGDEGVERLAVCPGCFARDGADWSLFPVDALGALSLLGSHTACPFHPDAPVPLTQLVPDLQLLDVPNLLHFRLSHFSNLQFLSRGGQGAVFSGTYAQTEIALKAFHCPESWDQGSVSHISPNSSHTSPQSSVLCRNVTMSGRTRQAMEESEGSTGAPSLEEELKVSLAFQRLRREVLFLSSLDHECIVRLLGVLIGPRAPLGLVLELAPLGDLFSVLEDRRREALAQAGGQGLVSLLPRLLTHKVAWQISVALTYLHSKSILYRDLKAENVLVWSLQAAHPVNVKLSDYGISAWVGAEGMVGAEGTRGYQAPEVVGNMKYDDKADMFSYGMVLFELLSGERPFAELPSGDDMSRAVKDGKRPSLASAGVRPDLVDVVDLMEECWGWNPAFRPSAAAASERLGSLASLSLKALLPVPSSASAQCALAEAARQDGFALVHYEGALATPALPELPAAPLPKLLLALEMEGLVWLSGGREDDRRASFLHMGRSEWEEKDIHWPGPPTAQAASSGPLHFLLSWPSGDAQEPQLEVYRSSKGTFLPSFVAQHPLRLPSAPSSLTVSPIQDKQVVLVVACDDGSLHGFRITENLENLQRVSEWREELSHAPPVMVFDASQKALIFGVAEWLEVWEVDLPLETERTARRRVEVFPADCAVESLALDGAGGVWCGSRDSGTVVQVDLATGEAARRVEVRGSVGTRSVWVERGLVWVGLEAREAGDGRLALLSTEDGAEAGSLQLPAHPRLSRGRVEAMTGLGERVVCLVEYSDARAGAELQSSLFVRKASRFHRRYAPRDLPSPASGPPATPQTSTQSSADTEHKLIVWDLITQNLIISANQCWDAFS